MDNEHVTGADDLIRKLKAAEEYIRNDVPVVVGVEAVNHFKESFINEGFTDRATKKWQSRKSKRSGGTNKQSVLSKSGELKDSLTYRVQGNRVIISTDKKYAQIHNEGGEIKVTKQMAKYFWSQYMLAKESENTELMDQWRAMALSKTITIPKRQYIGESEVLNQNITAKIERDLTNILSWIPTKFIKRLKAA